MKKDEVKIGDTYVAKVSGRLVEVRVDSTNRQGGWNATNIATGKRIRLKSAQRLRRGASTQAVVASDASLREAGIHATGSAMANRKKAQRAKARGGAGVKAEHGSGKPAKVAHAKRVGCLDAAAMLLDKLGRPMDTAEMITEMAEQQLWSSPGGKTPHATLYSAIIREIARKGKSSRFVKTDRGQFALSSTAKSS
ncbi:MAG: winged helix-turn-helix domain-containing protein [Phycisphaerae bacterium]|nr:winged helix-turn-helix domain-containing protein [Phycisphaerae bacterium]